MRLVFISDLHLSPETTTQNVIFKNLMQRLEKELDALYILGDFFDYYLGDDDDNQFLREIKQILTSFTQHKPIYFITGNHDFGIGKRFAKETGITMLKDCSIITHNHQRILLSHGDVFCTLDIGYQRFKKILQNPMLIWILRKTPLAWRYKLKDRLEHSASKQFNSNPPETYLVVKESIAYHARKQAANIVIHGHTHNPGEYQINLESPINGNHMIKRFEIPDWVDHPPGGYILLDEHEIKVVYG